MHTHTHTLIPDVALVGIDIGPKCLLLFAFLKKEKKTHTVEKTKLPKICIYICFLHMIALELYIEL